MGPGQVWNMLSLAKITGEWGNNPSQFGVKDANAKCKCPLEYVMFQNFKLQISCITLQ